MKLRNCKLLITTLLTLVSGSLCFVDKSSGGLSHDEVNTIMTDSRGYVWIGTALGLNRYDGSRMKVYYKDDLHLSSDFVLALGEDIIDEAL